MIYSQEQRRGHIRDLQTTLPQLIPDGIFGPETTEAVLQAQQEFGLMPTGIVDRVTWNTLFAARENRTAPPPVALRPGGFPLLPGAEDPTVALLQVMLQALSRQYEGFVPPRITGILDDDTLQEVRRITRLSGEVPEDHLSAADWNRVALLFHTLA